MSINCHPRRNEQTNLSLEQARLKIPHKRCDFDKDMPEFFYTPELLITKGGTVTNSDAFIADRH